jgi:hypothetical protein
MFAYQDRRYNEKHQFRQALGVRMSSRVEDLVERYALETCNQASKLSIRPIPVSVPLTC